MAETKAETKKKDTIAEIKAVSYVCVNKCYALDQIFKPGDVVTNCDMSGNKNFEIKK